MQTGLAQITTLNIILSTGNDKVRFLELKMFNTELFEG